MLSIMLHLFTVITGLCMYICMYVFYALNNRPNATIISGHLIKWSNVHMEIHFQV